MWGISLLAENQLASQEGLFSMEQGSVKLDSGNQCCFLASSGKRYLGILDEANFSEHMSARWQLSLLYIDIDHVSYLMLNLPKNQADNLYSGRMSYSNLSLDFDYHDQGIL